ncbi:MAG: hypothetical protein ACM3TN_02210 [Alphaproteobacteria bacterium]
MSEAQIRDYAAGKNFHPQTVERWLAWREQDREDLFRLAYGLKLSENHLRDFLDWLEEIALRDQRGIGEILSGHDIVYIQTDPRLGRADKLKRIKEQIRRLRFPRLAATEDALRTRIQELKLHPEIRLSVSAGLEGGKLHVEFNASSPDGLRRLAAKLVAAADQQLVREIFALLTGKTAED